MHCPRCGQQQVSEEIKFCSRCGFPLGLVAELLAYGGYLPQLSELGKKSGKKITRRNGALFSLFWALFFVLIMTPFWGIVDVDELAAMSAIIGIFGGLLMLLFSLFFLKPAVKEYPALPADQSAQGMRNFAAPGRQSALPPQQTQPAESYIPPINSWKAPDTGELAQPGSVTERTTKLLTRDE